MNSYNAMELMICIAARNLQDGATVVVGTGAPCAAAMLAQKRHAPNLCILFEAGGVAPRLPTMPVSVGDSRTVSNALMASSMSDIMETCQRGMVDFAFLGGAQIDMYGNLNSTLLGTDYTKPDIRLPGSGGAGDLASLCWKTMVMMPQDTRRFTPRLDFLTTPGYLTGGRSREISGLPKGTGPHRVITNMAVMGFDDISRRMTVLSVNPGYSRHTVQSHCGFELLWADTVDQTEPPGAEELKLLRSAIDPGGYVIGRAG